MDGPLLGRISYPMNESSLYTIAEVGVTLAGFSGLVVAFLRRNLSSWSPGEFLSFFFLISNSLLVVAFSLLPIPLLLWGLSESTIWALCSPLMAVWFIGGDVAIIRWTRHNEASFDRMGYPLWFWVIQWATLPVAASMGIVLLLSAADLLIPRGQAPYVLGLILMLLFAGIQFADFVIAGRRTDATGDAGEGKHP
jgi:hypothetical protein